MDAIGESHARVLPRAFEAAEIRAQHFNFTEAVVCDRIAHPDRCWIESENVADLQNQSVALRQLVQLFRLGRFQTDRLFDKHVLAGIEQLAADFKMSLRRSNNDRRIDDREKRMRVCSAMTLRNARRIQSFRIAFRYKKFDRHRLQNPQVVRTPTPKPDEKNSFRLLHLLPLISKVRHLARSISWQAIDTLSALASTARISQMRERCRSRKVLLWRPAHQVRQHTGSSPLSPRVLRPVTL